MGMLTRQITVAFETPVDTHRLAEVLRLLYGDVVVGSGIINNGIPENYILVENRTKHE
jgi:hypothetical protein